MHEAAYIYRVYPTPEQAQHLARTFGCVRYVFNRALEKRANAYHQEGVTLRYGDTSRMLTNLKKDADHTWLNDVSNVPLQQALRHLEKW